MLCADRFFLYLIHTNKGSENHPCLTEKKVTNHFYQKPDLRYLLFQKVPEVVRSQFPGLAMQ